MRKYLSIGSVICGILTFFFIGLTILSFDQEAQTLDALGNAVEAPSDRVLPENEGKVVVVSGRIASDGYFAFDETFEVGVDSPILRRNVDVYQWVKKTEGMGEAEEEYYEREWSDAKPVMYGDNPSSKPYEGRVFCSEFRLGEYRLAPELVEKFRFLGQWVDVGNLGWEAVDKYGLVLSGDAYYYYQNPGGQYVDVGDAKIYYEALDISGLSAITVAAKQEGDMLVELRGDGNMFLVGDVFSGVMSAEDVFGAREDDMAYAKVVGFVLIIIFGAITALLVRGNIKKHRFREQFGVPDSGRKWGRK